MDIKNGLVDHFNFFFHFVKNKTGHFKNVVQKFFSSLKKLPIFDDLVFEVFFWIKLKLKKSHQNFKFRKKINISKLEKFFDLQKNFYNKKNS